MLAPLDRSSNSRVVLMALGRRRAPGLRPLFCTLLLAAFGALSSGQAIARDKANDGDTEGVDPNAPPVEMTMTLEQLLSDPEGVEEGGEQKRCINRRIATQTTILDSEHLLFKSGVGKRVWLNRLGRGCVGLRRDMIVVLESRDSSLCALDQVYGLSRASGAGISSGRCSLGKFEPITAQHAAILKESFRIRGREMEEARRKERREARAKRKQEKRARREAKRAAKAANQTG